jgi:hypothetical protein
MMKSGHFHEIAYSNPLLHGAEWTMGPNRVGFDYFSSFLSDPELAERELFYLPGNILRWYHIYGRFPSTDSWVWKFFPFGERWLQAVQAVGKDAVDLATSQHYYSVDGDAERRSAFSNISLSEAGGEDTFGIVPPVGTVIFFHITADSGWDVVSAQLQAVGSLAREQTQNVSLFYSVVGESGGNQSLSADVGAFCTSGIACKALPHFPIPYEGETLHQLHRFCQRHPAYVVSYVQSDLPPYMKQQIEDPSQRYNLLVHLSRVALSLQCINAVRSEGESSPRCNTCGLVFYKLWTLFYPGNMFTASCKYVNDLLPPSTFERRMEEYVKAALLARLSGDLRSQVFIGPFPRTSVQEPYQADLLELWGLDRFSVDFWLGSHPKMNPCDVSGSESRNLSYWQGLAVDTSPKSGKETRTYANGYYDPVAEAPSHDGSPFHFDPNRYNQAMSDNSTRMLEVTFLAGHLARWYHLYGSAPNSSSRLWNMFPDSEHWKERTLKEGKAVVMKTLAIAAV